MSEKKPLFSRSIGKSDRYWNNLGVGTDAEEVCELCGTTCPEGGTRMKFLGREAIEQCCGRALDIVLEESGEEITREYLKDFSEDPFSPKFKFLLDQVLDALEGARQKADKFLEKSNVQEDIKKFKEAWEVKEK